MSNNHLKDKLFQYSKTYISLDELTAFINFKNYHEQHDCISKLISEGIIKPIIKKDFTNGKIPPLYTKYRILKPKTDNSDLISEIKHLEGSFCISYYLKNVNKYKQQREIILPLSDFLKDYSDKLNWRISKNERAYQIWNYEKTLDSPTAKTIIELNNLREKLNYYNTPEPFFYYTPEKNRFSENTVLIIENKDTWYSFREIMRNVNDSVVLFEHKIDGILYGEGKKVIRESFSLSDFCETELKHKCDFLYFGDLDYEGIGIYQTLKKQSTDFDLQLFSKLYVKLIELSNLTSLRKVEKQQKEVDITLFLQDFCGETVENIKWILSDGRYIPQEALNKNILENLITDRK
ncbi:MAG: DUF2220 domain-containing protein [Methanosphaera sp.]|nr:DUF2220 domain-containing protein [Clostridiales bacterium]MCD7781580.1 DUF2220 domain-containing protein [Methanosphaera sp.]